MVQGFFLGILGAGIAFAAEWMLYDALITKIAQMDGMGLFDFVPFQELLVPMIVTFSAAGLFVGIFGSISAIRKFMDV
jgi:cell division transport system permease protein